jgi:two-component system sensor histidine kinase DesK
MKAPYIPDAKKPRPLWAWAWFAYTGFLFIEPIMAPTPRSWLSALLSFAIFAVIFVYYQRVCDEGSPIRFGLIAATFVLGLATLPFNPGATTFFIYTAGFLPFNIRSSSRVLGLIALEAALVLTETRLLHLGLANAVFAVFLMIVIGGGNIFYAEQKRSDFKLRLANDEIEALAAVAERERIARDLHDVLGHTLSLIVLKAELAGRLLSQGTEAATARATEVREAIGGYRSRGLAAEIESARQTLAAAGVDLHAEAADVAGTKLTPAEETVLALALREAVTNIVRHAHARTCRLRFSNQQGFRRLVIEDDGEHATAREGNGLRGMRERVESLGGHLLLNRESGTRLEVELPA